MVMVQDAWSQTGMKKYVHLNYLSKSNRVLPSVSAYWTHGQKDVLGVE